MVSLRPHALQESAREGPACSSVAAQLEVGSLAQEVAFRLVEAHQHPQVATEAFLLPHRVEKAVEADEAAALAALERLVSLVLVPEEAERDLEGFEYMD